MAILVKCDACGEVAGTVWNFKTKTWHTPASWSRHDVWSEVDRIMRHACSVRCRARLVRKSHLEVAAARGHLRLVGPGGKRGP